MMQIAQLANRAVSVLPEVQHLLRKVEQHAPGGRQRAVLRRAVEKRLTEFIFQAPDCLTDGRLSAVQRFCRARKTLLVCHSQKYFQLIYVHRFAFWVRTLPACLMGMIRCAGSVLNQRHNKAWWEARVPHASVIQLSSLGYRITDSYLVIVIITLTFDGANPTITGFFQLSESEDAE